MTPPGSWTGASQVALMASIRGCLLPRGCVFKVLPHRKDPKKVVQKRVIDVL